MNMNTSTTLLMSRLHIALTLVGLCASQGPSIAQAQQGESESALEERVNLGLTVGAKVGAGLGAPLSDFGGTPAFELELGYLLPVDVPQGHELGIFFSGLYVQPGVDGSASAPDSRLPGDGIVHYEVTQQELVLSLGGMYRIDIGSRLLMPYGGLGGRMYLLNTNVTGDVAGEPYGDSDETKTSFGLVVMAGVELMLGPGALLAELQMGWAPLDAYVMRDTNLGALSLAVGYRLFL
jgi:hypothetical protein